jgi:hypothetical protein
MPQRHGCRGQDFPAKRRAVAQLALGNAHLGAYMCGQWLNRRHGEGRSREGTWFF